MEYIITKDVKPKNSVNTLEKGAIVYRTKRLSKIKSESIFQHNNCDVILRHEDVMAKEKCSKTNML